MNQIETFIDQLTLQAAAKEKQRNRALWLLETTGSRDAADLKADLDIEYRTLFSDAEHFELVKKWSVENKNPQLKRSLKVLLNRFHENQIPRELIVKIAETEALLTEKYANFRPILNRQAVSENEIRQILKKENNYLLRKEAWEASKEIGNLLAPLILELVHLRNQAAHALGFTNYFSMQLHFQEVEETWLFKTLDQLYHDSESAYSELIQQIKKSSEERFKISAQEFAPWAFAEPFAQEDPLEAAQLDQLIHSLDLIELAKKYYAKMGFEVEPILARSDMYERAQKNQHAFCINIDRKKDIRTLNNVKPTIKWFETIFHELGHAVYELGYDQDLPWLLREPPHMLTTEAMALIAGRQVYRSSSLKFMFSDKLDPSLLNRAESSLKRRQLIFSRWVLVMSYFERALYQNPKQDLNKLWWQLVLKYQKIPMPISREGHADWAAKYHLGLAPVYYYSYLLGEMLASSLEAYIKEKTGMDHLADPKVGELLHERFFSPGNSLDWKELVEAACEKPFTPSDWVRQFCN